MIFCARFLLIFSLYFLSRLLYIFSKFLSWFLSTFLSRFVSFFKICTEMFQKQSSPGLNSWISSSSDEEKSSEHDSVTPGGNLRSSFFSISSRLGKMEKHSMIDNSPDPSSSARWKSSLAFFSKPSFPSSYLLFFHAKYRETFPSYRGAKNNTFFSKLSNFVALGAPLKFQN